MKCSLCLDENEEENESHLLKCPIIVQKLGEECKNVKFDDIYLNISKQTKAVKLFRKIMNIYEKPN